MHDSVIQRTIETEGAMMIRRRHQIFLSSTYEDLKEERRLIIQRLFENDYIPAGMEGFPAAPNPPWALIERLMDDSDYYVLVIGQHYGSIDPETGLSFTHSEYREARRRGNIPILAFLIETNEAALTDQRLVAFRQEVHSDSTASFKRWHDASDLANKVIRALDDALKTAPRDGWIRQRDAIVSKDVAYVRDSISTVRKDIAEIGTTLQHALGELSTVDAQLTEAVTASEASYRYKTMLLNKNLLDQIYGHTAEELLKAPFEILRDLSEAKLHVTDEWIGKTFDVLASAVKERYDGVSSDDLTWWLDDKNFSAVRYLTRNKEIVDDGKTATRLFILKRQKLIKQKDKLQRVLSKHERLDIAWAVAIEEDLPPTKLRNFDIDFGLFDQDKAVSFFHNYSEVSREPRRFDVYFNTGGRDRQNDDKVARHLRGYRSLVNECRLVSSRFVSCHIGAAARSKPFPLIARDDADIPQKIDELIELDRIENRRVDRGARKSTVAVDRGDAP